MMRARFDPDSPYLVHSRSATLHFVPLPADILSIIDANQPPPVAVRNTEPRKRDRPPRHETRYGLRGYGPTNKSGKAKS